MDLEAGRRVAGGEGIVELRERAVGEAHNAHHAVLQPIMGHAATRGHRIDRDRLGVEHEAQRVGVVDGDVEDDAAAGLGLVDAPALQMRGQIDRVKDTREQRPADPAREDRLAHRAMGRGVAQVMVRAERHAARPACVDDRPGVGKGHAPAASRTIRACLRPPPPAPGRGAARWSWRYRRRRCRPPTSAASSVVERRMSCLAANAFARSALALITATTSPPLARIAPIMC